MENKKEDIYGSRNLKINLLELFGFTDKELRFFSMSKKGKYKKIIIPKRTGGNREIHSPVYKLKNAQKIILKDILYKELSGLLVDNVTGFIPGKSIKDNAKFHVAKKFILKIDIKDFFPSITQDRIYGLLRKEYDLDHQTSMYISSLCCYNNELPQGAPTSPILSNLIARFLDYKLLGLLKSYNEGNDGLSLTYSRYADDLTFSFNKKIKVNILINYIISILLEEGFYPNYKKIHLISSGKQQKITGVVVNSKIGVGRIYYKKFKSIFYNISQNGFDNELTVWNEKHKSSITDVKKFKQILGGYLSFIRELSPEYYKKLLEIKVDLK